jgi:acetyl-CoA synthetase
MGDVSREAAEVAIDVLLQERREFPPPREFVSQAVASDPDIYERAEADLDGFWLDQTRSLLDWHKEPTVGLEWDPPHCTWFADGVLNVSSNCLDRHVAVRRGGKVAYQFTPQ